MPTNPPTLPKAGPNETSRYKTLQHVPDLSRWRDTPSSASFHPNQFQIFDRDNNIGSDVTNFSIILVEISASAGGARRLIAVVDYDLRNHSQNLDADEEINISFSNDQEKILFQNA